MFGEEMEDSVLSRNRKLFVTNLRYGKAHFRQFRAEPKPGDLIEISRIGSSHWALYVGDGDVVHLAPPGENSEAGAPTCLGEVKREPLLDVVGNCSYKVNNHLDHLYKPRPIKEMIRSGKEMVGKEMEYRVLSRNCERFVTDLRYGKARSRQLREEPKPGDLIEILCFFYSHWALYVGDGYVIHLGFPGEKSESGAPTGLGVVKRQLLVEVLGICSYKVNNHLDHLYKPRPIEEMIRSGKEMVGQEMEYSILSRNCEHFVTDLRYGKARSPQFHVEPEPGDLVEIPRIGSSHWALYVGDGYVIHLAPPGENSEAGAPTGLGEVKRQLLVEVVGNCSYKVNNHLDHLYKPRPINEMLRSGKEMVGKEMEYRVLSRTCERFVTDLRYGKACSRQLREEPKPGDLIEILCFFYSHWALYVGDGYVIHLGFPGEKSESGAPTGLGVVKRQLLVEVLGICSYKVNNHLDHLYKPRPIEEMIRSGKEMVGQEMEYSILSRNCEHFVTDLRYGKARSPQFRAEPKPGDLIEIPRIGSSHWALYVGNGDVIHLAPPGENSEAGAPTGLGVVKRQLLVEVVGNCSYKVNNHLDHLYKPRPIEEMLRSGKEMLGQEMEYSDLSRNCEHFVTDLRYGKAHNLEFREEPKPGDLIEILHIGYSHWALYVGDGYVIHLDPPGENSEAGAPTGLGEVKRQLLVEVVGNCFYKVNNYLDHLYKPRPIKEMLSAGKEMLGMEMEYSVLSRNCEHFVTDLRYGKARSRKIRAEPEPGDLIEISRIGSSHWALYMGDGDVIHLAPPGENSEAGAPTGLGEVKRQLLVEVVGNCSYKVNNHLDHLYKPRPIKEMLSAGKEMLGMEMEYSVLSRNCEHFVTDLRYGKARSRKFHAEPKPGDLIEISRIGSSHWALYVGDGYVIHLAPPGENSEAGAPTGLGEVKRQLLVEVLENCSYEVNNHLDHLYKPRPIHEMISSGKEMVGKEMEHSVLSRTCEHFVTDLRYGKVLSRKFRAKPKPGDLIEISRIGSSHWALYVGDGAVVHLAPPGENSESGAPTGLGEVKRQLLVEVVGKCSYEVNNHLDHLYKPRPIEEMVSSGKEMVGKEMEYSDLSRNCEHFVTDLRYGKARSRQFREEPKPGDLIRIFRFFNSHWALYVGDGDVIHLAPPGENSEAGAPTGLGKVKKEFLVEVVGHCFYKVNNHLDHLYKPRPINEMLRSGKEMVGKEMEYSDLSRNCEHFVTDLRYGKARIRQFLEEPEPGDLIEIPRIGSLHWALYVGDGDVIHLAPPGEKSEAGAPTGLGEVKRQLLVEVVGNCSYKVNNHLDHLYKPRPIKEMLSSGKEMVGKEMEYSVLSRTCEHFVTDLRYGKARSRKFRAEPKPGDLIEISRTGSSHWALYVGDGDVIHLAPPGENSEAGSPTGLGEVKRELLMEVVGNCSYKVINHLDHLYKPKPIKEMLSSGKEMVGTEMEYSDLSRNCEHFVTDLRYGKARSRQIRAEPKPGDLIEIPRIGSSHWALYVGDGDVIHLAPPGENSEAGAPTGLGEVKRQLLVEVVGNCSYKVNNHLDHLYKPRPIKEMLRSGKEMVGNEMEYSDLSRNCERLVINMRYGKARSRQFREEPEPGDLIEISRTGSSHWVLYMGDGDVIHLAPPGENSEAGAPTGLGVVKKELLVEVVGNCSFKVNNYLDHLYKPWPIKKIIEFGNWLVGKNMKHPDQSRNCEHFVTDLRYGNAHDLQLVKDPRPGDIIEISHRLNRDWALYVGDGYVIHLTAPGESRSIGPFNMPMFLSGRAEVTKEPLQKAAGGRPYKVNNHLDHKHRPRPVHEIITSAKEMIGNQKTYSVLRENSERFVADLRYGWPRRELSSEDPIPGDLIQIGDVYKHWAIYVGDGFVIHVKSGVSSGSSSSNLEHGYVVLQDMVKCEPLEEVAGDNTYKVNNFLDDKYRPRPLHDIVNLAKKKIGETWNDNFYFPTVSTLSLN